MDIETIKTLEGALAISKLASAIKRVCARSLSLSLSLSRSRRR